MLMLHVLLYKTPRHSFLVKNLSGGTFFFVNWNLLRHGKPVLPWCNVKDCRSIG